MSAQFLWLVFGAFVLFCVLTLFAIYGKGDIRAGCETPFGKFFLEARERSKELEKETKKALN